MIRIVIARLAQSVVVLFVLFTLTFLLVKALPYGPFQQEKAIPEHIRERIEDYYALNEPLPVQYSRALANLLRGDPGLSLRLEGRAVTEILRQAFPVSLQLGVAAMAVAVCIGIPGGILAAARRNSLVDHLTMALAMTGICLPGFVVGPVLAEFFGRRLGLLPVVGWRAADPATWILPAFTLGLVSAAYLSRLTRAGMLEVLGQGFVRTARAKGAGEPRVLVRHCLRGGLIPAVAYLGPAFAATVSGSVVIETIFHIPGLGQHFIKAIETGDGPVIQGIVLLYGSLILAANLATDLVQIWLNPRLRRHGSGPAG
jgi:oligopeptide transport system permease protein